MTYIRVNEKTNKVTGVFTNREDIKEGIAYEVSGIPKNIDIKNNVYYSNGAFYTEIPKVVEVDTNLETLKALEKELVECKQSIAELTALATTLAMPHE